MLIFKNYQFNLCYSGPISVTKIDEEGEININVCSDNQSIWISDTKNSVYQNLSLFNLSITNVDNEELSNDITLYTNDIEMILKCDKSLEQNKSSLTTIAKDFTVIYEIKGNTFFTCGILFSFQSLFYRYSGIFGYFLICFSFFNQVYGYTNQSFAFVFIASLY